MFVAVLSFIALAAIGHVAKLEERCPKVYASLRLARCTVSVLEISSK